MFGIIYCITNTVNKKKYIGQTRLGLSRRWQFHRNRAGKNSTFLLHKAIRKYGEKSFLVEQVDSADSLEHLNEKEIFYIKNLSTLSPNGYNLTRGGEGVAASTETKLKMSTAAKKRPHPRKQFCKNGHPFDAVNTYIFPDGNRHRCLTCFYINSGRRLPESLRIYDKRN